MELDEVLVENAARIYRLVPAAGISFTVVDAMIKAGISEDLAQTPTFQNRVNIVLTSLQQQHGPPTFDAKIEGKVERTMEILALWPKNTTPVVAEIMRLAGCTQNDTKAGPCRQRVQRKLNKWKNEKQRKTQEQEIHAESMPQQTQVPPVLDVQTRNMDAQFSPSVLSPLSSTTGTNPSPYTLAQNLLALPAVVPPLVLESPTTSNSSRPSGRARFQHKGGSQKTNNTVASLTAHIHTRLSAKQKQERRMLEKTEENIRSSMFKLGTMLWDGAKQGVNTLKKFVTAEQCAEAINEMFNIDCLSGRELNDAVKKRRVGVSPPRRGGNYKVPDNEFQLIAQLFFTLSAIEQANASPDRLSRPKLITLAGDIINEKLRDNGIPEMSDVKFYDRIQKANSAKQGVVVPNYREALRVKWLTYTNQLKNYKNWEKAVVELGFARKPVGEREQDEKGFVVFYEGQERRFCNLDEMPLPLDGAESTAGGRPASTPWSFLLPDAGQTSDKTSAKCTVVFGIIGDEPIPPLFIFPSKSTKADTTTIDTRNLLSFQQHHAQYGFAKKNWHDATVSANLKGGMNSEIFEEWITEHVMPLWPDLADIPGLRAMLKADMGPGRFGNGFLSRLFLEGMSFYPGLPNGTGNGQEMDALYSAVKSCGYRNRARLFNRRRALDPNATLTLQDVGYIIYGGTVTMKDGSTLYLEPAFELYFSSAHIRAAREKCGYCPATRNALKSSQIRHEAVEGEDGEIDDADEADPYGALLNELEKENHRCVGLLEELGYTKVSLAKRYVHRITLAQRAGRDGGITETLPNTRERQDLLQKVSTSGQFFQVTGGGGVLNTSDFLIARARRDMLKEAKKLQVIKKSAEFFTAIIAKAKVVFNKSPKKWTKGDFQVAIQYKVGKRIPGLSNSSAPELKTLYEGKYQGNRRVRPSSSCVWTKKQELRLQKCIDGEIDTITETMIYSRALQAQNLFLSTRLLSVTPKRRKEVLSKVFEGVSDDEKKDIVAMLSGDVVVPDTSDSSSSEISDGDDEESFTSELGRTVENRNHNDAPDDEREHQSFVGFEEEINRGVDTVNDTSSDADSTLSIDSPPPGEEDVGSCGSGRYDKYKDDFQDIDDASSRNEDLENLDNIEGSDELDASNRNEDLEKLDDREGSDEIDNANISDQPNTSNSSDRLEALLQRKLQSHADDMFEAKLKEAQNRKYLRLCDLDVLLQSRNVTPNTSSDRKMKLELWAAQKNQPMAWRRTANWTNFDEEELLNLE